MFEDHVSIDTGEGEMSTFVVHPEPSERRPGPFPTVLFLMDAPGKREELHHMARRIASVGYYVLLPNLYYRDVPRLRRAAGRSRQPPVHVRVDDQPVQRHGLP